MLDGYFEKALLPALESRGIKSVGVFTELEVNKTDQTGVAKPDTPVWVLIPHATLDSFVTVSAELNSDPAYRRPAPSTCKPRRPPRCTSASTVGCCWPSRAIPR